MSQAASDQTFQLACYGSISATLPEFTTPCPFGYPLNSGHNGVRGAVSSTERNLRADQYAMIGQLHGMAGVGSAKLTADAWLQAYNTVMQDMGGDSKYTKPYDPSAPVGLGTAVSNGIVAGFGTDTDGLEFGMPPRQGRQIRIAGPQIAQYKACLKGPKCTAQTIVEKGNNGKPVTTRENSCIASCLALYPNAFQLIWSPPPPNVQYSNDLHDLRYGNALPQSTDGSKSWNYNTDGVAHYGMLWDFLQDVSSLPGGAAMTNNNFMYGADYFYHTWQKAEMLSSRAPN